MAIDFLHIPPEEIVRLLRAEISATEGQPELFVSAWEDDEIEKDFDGRSYESHDGWGHVSAPSAPAGRHAAICDG